jgi:Na+/H+ antiporter NhaD/arsenite permease-like protein
MPLIPAAAHWWDSNKTRLLVSLCLAGVTLAYYGLVAPMVVDHESGATHRGFDGVLHVLDHAVVVEYLPFIILLFSLYVISGGISLRGDLPAHPATNTAFLAAGGVLASFIGTTGASMLLIRPLLQTNSERHRVRHTVVFFIFIVSNCGGLLLPLGDPPLFLGYLKGVPFLWTLHLVPEWATVCGALLLIYFVWDSVVYKREARPDIVRDEAERTPLRFEGMHNLVLLLGIVLCVALVDPSRTLPVIGVKPYPFVRELLMLGLVGLSCLMTRKDIYAKNQFTLHAIIEVAALFIGIFICMQPPIEILRARGAALGLHEPWHFFWATGMLSSFLDNAPTYVVFLTTAQAQHVGANPLALTDGFVDPTLLVAVSLGAVFMGANTYIGNGPNFMVKSIAERSGVKMPSFFGYMLYSGGVLIPLFVLVTYLFLR